jgi:lysozyme family protein
MINNFPRSLELVLKEEGGYVWDKRDPGGETMMGVTRNAWSTWLKRPINDGEMAKLTIQDVTPFYKALYWGSLCDNLPLGLDYLIFDASVNIGRGRAIELLQMALGCVPDGSIGPNTLKAILNSKIENTINQYCTQKELYYKGLKQFPIYGTGWLARVSRSKTNAMGMLNG